MNPFPCKTTAYCLKNMLRKYILRKFSRTLKVKYKNFIKSLKMILFLKMIYDDIFAHI